jgi:hypothetical protein
MKSKPKKSISTVRMIELVQYTEFAPHLAKPKDVKKILQSLLYIKDWAFIYHTDDEKGKHIHLMMRFDNPKPLNQIANAFGVKEQYLERIKGQFDNALAYLVHANTPQKHQYNTKDVYTNIVDIDAKIEKHRHANLDDIFERISTGEIRRYNVVNYMSVNDYIRHKKQIDLAFEYYEKKNINYDRKMQVIYIFGDSGTGKTTLAKRLLNHWGKSYYLSSGGDNMLDNYEGQPAILLDDFRDTQMKHPNFLKLLDPFTSSMAAARYRDKTIYCDMIIVTAVMPVDSLYSFNNEDRIQILRRLPVVIHLKQDGNELEISVYNSAICAHLPCASANITLDKDNIKQIADIIEKEMGNIYGK